MWAPEGATSAAALWAFNFRATNSDSRVAVADGLCPIPGIDLHPQTLILLDTEERFIEIEHEIHRLLGFDQEAFLCLTGFGSHDCCEFLARLCWHPRSPAQDFQISLPIAKEIFTFVFTAARNRDWLVGGMYLYFEGYNRRGFDVCNAAALLLLPSTEGNPVRQARKDSDGQEKNEQFTYELRITMAHCESGRSSHLISLGELARNCSASRLTVTIRR